MSPVSPKFAKEIIRKIRYITIATVDQQGQPWNTPVARSVDDDLNFYWASDKTSTHSQNIRQNNKVFIVIYDSTVPSKDAWGVYVKAKAEEITDQQEADSIAKLFAKDDPYSVGTGKEYLDDYPRRIYKAVPEKVWMNDEGEVNGNYIDVRKEVEVI